MMFYVKIYNYIEKITENYLVNDIVESDLNFFLFFFVHNSHYTLLYYKIHRKLTY